MLQELLHCHRQEKVKCASKQGFAKEKQEILS
jgi:hypothetical protein